MKPEIEAKFLDVNHEKIREVLKSKGAKLVQPRQLMKRKNFDFPGRKLQEIGGWVRVRDEGNKVTLAYKQLDHRGVDGTKEVYVVVNSFDDTCLLLESIGLECSSYQETKRESWVLGNVEIELDEWPWIKPFIEIEAPDEGKLKKVTKLLGLIFEDALHGSVEIAYQAEYNVTELDVDSWKEITFIDVPKWLEKKRIK
jgi:adenylate cyclase class 2